MDPDKGGPRILPNILKKGEIAKSKGLGDCTEYSRDPLIL